MTSRTPIVHVVDDDASFRNAIGRFLRSAGYQVALYESGDQFLDDPAGKEPGCILLDLQMSGLDGLQLQDRLHQLELDPADRLPDRVRRCSLERAGHEGRGAGLFVEAGRREYLA